MYNLHFICTQHRENGICNSTELHRVIDRISPEIIFEELPNAIYNEVYNKKSRTTLESNAIKRYLQNHSIKHIPVDTYNRPKYHDENVGRMYRELFDSAKRESHNFRSIMDQFETVINQKGFSFLNSDKNDEVLEVIENQKEKILGILNDESLFEISRAEKEVIEKRENIILDNVYSFSKENDYSQAILFIGSGHRRSMFKKIAKRKNLEQTEINWILYNE